MLMKRRQLLAVTVAPLLLDLSSVTAHAAADPASLGFADLYKSRTVLGMAFSEKTTELAGKPVAVAGYMAPPLKPESAFFVLTRTPVSICPFCSSDADWPADIIVVYLHSPTGFLQDGSAVKVTGVLQMGSQRDPETGFVSLLRLVDASVRRI
jgi:hypothetical protein